MATIQISNNYVNTSPNVDELVYTAPTNKETVIEAITVANNSGVNASYSLYIKAISEPLQAIVKDKIVVWGRSDLAIGAVNHIIPIGGELRFESSAINSNYLTVTARQV